MNLTQLIQAVNKPQLYTPGNSTMWNDPYISRHLLKTHLNETIDLASRKRTQIDRTIKWILEQVRKEPLEILDLGCGPGLYTETFAEMGHRVTGVDISPNSIEYAKASARKKGLTIDYHTLDYLTLKPEISKYDLIIMIYTDMGVLRPDQRNKLLETIALSLKPGGMLIFDVMSDSKIEQKVTSPTWETSLEGGFWNKDPYLALSNSFLYKDQKVILYQHVIIQEDVPSRIYRFWTHYFSREDLKTLLKAYPLTGIDISDHILEKDDQWSGENVLFCKSIKC